MALAHSPRIVTDGLVLALDAGNTKSYPGSGTTWTDLSGRGNNGTLTNGPTYNSSNGGSIVFDGLDDLVQVADNVTLDIAGDKTLSCWVYMGADSAGCGIAGKMNGTVYGMSLAYGWGSKGFQAIAWNSSNAPQLDKDLSRDINKWVYISATQSGTTRTIYAWDILGIRIASGGTGTHSWDNNLSFIVGRSNSGSSVPANTGISQIYVYNRALTAAEIKQNFNAMRGRYGI
jgi:hypothetical protein